MQRVVERILPDRSKKRVQPFHISLEGLEKCILCRDDEDYDVMVKIICVAARRKNVIVIIYAVVSNHCHVAVLALSQKDADSCGNEIKRIYSMWFSQKYKEKEIMQNTDAKAIWLDNDWYVRNALAYIPRNSIDNGCNVHEYRWSGYNAMFLDHAKRRTNVMMVSELSKRERLRIMHTGDDLRDVGWELDDSESLIPESVCDYHYLEQAFEYDQSFFLKTIGGQNVADMHNKLVDMPRKRQSDGEFFKTVSDISQRWFKSDISTLSVEKKIRLIPYVFHTTRTSIPQLARVFALPRETIAKITGKGLL